MTAEQIAKLVSMRVRAEAGRSPMGIRLFHHLTRPDDYGWGTDAQIAAFIRRVERDDPLWTDLRITRGGVYLSMPLLLVLLIVSGGAVITTVLT